MKAALLLVVGVAGLVQTLAPRPVVRAWTNVVYSDAGDATPREFVYVVARIEGAVLVLASVFGLYRLATADTEPADDGVYKADDSSPQADDR